MGRIGGGYGFATGLQGGTFTFVRRNVKRKIMERCCTQNREHAAGCCGKGGRERIFSGRMGVSLAVLAAGLVLGNVEEVGFFQGGVEFAWYVLAYLPVGLPVWKEAWREIRKGDVFNEFTLMSLASVGALGIGEYPEAVAVMLFYSIGEAFQERAVDHAKRNISDLLDVRPETVDVLREGEWRSVHPQEVMVGEVIEVKTGGRVPLDGSLMEGKASFDTAALTGESVPRTIRQDEEVLAGMIVTDRVIRMQVTRPYAESALSRILEMVEHASERKAPAELFIRKFARVYTPAVFGLAVLIVMVPWVWSLTHAGFVFEVSEWLYRALVFLVISCPCALVVSIPLGYFSGIGAASRLGVLFKGGNYLHAITKIDTVVFDKTGTLTKGVFEVQAVETAGGMTAGEVVAWVAAAEQHSTHPIAWAVARYAERQGIRVAEVADVEEVAGCGLRAKVGGKEVLAGNTRLLENYGVAYPAELRAVEGTMVACAVDGQYAGYLLLADCLKDDAVRAVADLKAAGIREVEILSGDRQAIVSAFAARVGVAAAYGDLLPEGKVAHIEALREAGRRVAFVGDGMNDAPVLALSDVGIAMGGLGSDAAIETADVVIQTDQPSRVATAVRAGRVTLRVVWQNIVLAFGVKFAVLLLGAWGMATMWEAVFADVGVALVAVLNAVRIQRMIKI